MNGTAIIEMDETEVLPPEIKEKLDHELEPYRHKVPETTGERKPITNAAEAMVAEVFVAQRKRDYKELEEIRDRLVRPYNTIVGQINKAFKTETTLADQDWRTRELDLDIYRTEEQARIDAANRKAIADAAEITRQEEAKAEAARQEAERIRKEAERLEQAELDRQLQVEMDRLAAEQKIKDEQEALARAKREGDVRAAREAQESIDRARLEEEERIRKAEHARLAAVAEQNALEKQAIKQDAKADIAESKATMVSPVIEVNNSVGKRVLDNGQTVGTRKVEDWRFDNGLQVYQDPLTRKKYADYYADDVRLNSVEIPRSCLLVDLAKLGKIVKAGVPIKGCTMFKRNATTADRK